MAGRCDQEDILAGNDDPALPLVTCSQDQKYIYILDKSIISGDQIKDATSGFDQQSGAYVVDLEFKDEAATTWGDFTAANIGTQTAFTLDSQVVSAPQIREAIPGGRTQISGGDPPFTVDSSKQLANVLKYGSLPLSFESSEAETVSATLGLTSLRAGLIAGAIGLAMVLLYSLLRGKNCRVNRANVSIRRIDGTWQVAQVLGFANFPARSWAMQVAQHLADRVNVLSAATPQTAAQIDFIEDGQENTQERCE